MLKIDLPLVVMLAVLGCKKDDKDTGSDEEFDQEMVETD